jgi:hypothetical protein
VSTITIPITNDRAGYDLFLKCKTLPRYKVFGNIIETDDLSYQFVFGGEKTATITHHPNEIEFDYQRCVVQRALERERYAAFLDCGLGKTIIELTYMHDVVAAIGGKAIIFCPLSVMEDIQREHVRLYGVRMNNLRKEKMGEFSIINYESMAHVDMSDVACAVLDESSVLKSGDGATCNYLNELTAHTKFKLACSATPSPNDQAEYASHAVYLGICATQKEFYSRFFVKDGTTWRMKGHASDAFYNFLKSWCCYIKSPSIIGFQRGAELDHEPEYIIQKSYPVGDYYSDGSFLATGLSMIAASKIFGQLRADKNEDRFKNAIESIQNKRSIIWCNRNIEEDVFARELRAQRINGQTPIEKRVEIIDAFKRGEIMHIVSKPSVLCFGVNIQEAEAHLYSGYNFSFEKFYQAVRRSHRYGRVGRLKVFVPVSEPETPIWDALQRKLNTFNADVISLQNRFFDV